MKSWWFLPMVTMVMPAALAAHGGAWAPERDDAGRRIEFPDTAGHLTLAVDLHTHSVFSDGHVWPKIRVEEALRDGLDAIAITEHLEWQPHRADIPHADRNRAYEIAREAAAEHEILVIAGSEVTRRMPAGHLNAIFLSDANALFREPAGQPLDGDPRRYFEAAREWPAAEAVAAAREQGAFVFWNHPAWRAQALDGIAAPTDFHLAAIARGELHGVEVANGVMYSEAAFQFALDHDLTLLGVSDIHELIDWDYPPAAGEHRPVTLVFAEERNVEALRRALFERRTAVWWGNTLLGREAVLRPLLEAALGAGDAAWVGSTDTVEVTLTNHSDARFLLHNRSPHTFLDSVDLIEVPPHQEVVVTVNAVSDARQLVLDLDVLNALTAPKRPARLRLVIAVESREDDPDQTGRSSSAATW